MTKKQWVAPSAQLVQFAANEYVAACGGRKVLNFIADIVNSFLMVESNPNDGWFPNYIAGGGSYNVINNNEFQLTDDNSTDWYKFVDAAYDKTLNDQMVSNTKGGWTEIKDTTTHRVYEDELVKGWYSNKDSDASHVLAWNWHEALIWYDSENDQIYAGKAASQGEAKTAS